MSEIIKATVVNIRKTTDYDVYCGRAGKGQDGYFGNPFPLLPGESRGSTIVKFTKYFKNRLLADAEFRRRVDELAGKKLGCFCKPQPCHVDIIASYVNRKL